MLWILYIIFKVNKVFPPNKNYLAFFCLVLWEQFPCFSLWISCMPQCNIILSVLIFDLYYFSVLLYKDNNLYTIVIVWYFNVVFCAVLFKVFYASLCAFQNYSLCAFKFLYQSVCMLKCSLCVFKLMSKIACNAYMNC